MNILAKMFGASQDAESHNLRLELNCLKTELAEARHRSEILRDVMDDATSRFGKIAREMDNLRSMLDQISSTLSQGRAADAKRMIDNLSGRGNDNGRI